MTVSGAPYILFLLMLAVFFVLFPLWWRPRVRQPLDPGAGIRVFYHKKMRELGEDRAIGRVAESDFLVLQIELQRQILAMAQVEPKVQAEPGAQPEREVWVEGKARASLSGHPWLLSFFMLTAFPVLALGLHWKLQPDPEFLAAPTAVPRFAEGSQTSDQHAFSAMADQLQAQLGPESDDPIGLGLLAQALIGSGRYAEALVAFEGALATGGDQWPDLLVDFAEFLGAGNSGDLRGRPQLLLEEALGLDPDHIKGLWLSGTASLQSGDGVGAQRYWERLASRLRPESAAAVRVRENLEQLSRGPWILPIPSDGNGIEENDSRPFGRYDR